MALLIRILSVWPALAGLLVTVALIPLTMGLGKLLTRARRQSVAAADARVKLITEVITGAPPPRAVHPGPLTLAARRARLPPRAGRLAAAFSGWRPLEPPRREQTAAMWQALFQSPPPCCCSRLCSDQTTPSTHTPCLPRHQGHQALRLGGAIR